MKIGKNKVVALSYELEVEGAIADKATSEAPLEYIQGMRMLLPKFEKAVEGKEIGDTFEFTLSPDEGYGQYNPQYLTNIPLEAFAIDGEVRKDLLEIGRVLPMLSSEGQVVQGKVCEVTADTVVMDFNHPMAGKTLHFTGKVENVREATEKELKEGLHGEFLPPEESCHCHKGKGGCHGHGEDCGCHEGEDCGCHNGEDCNCEGGCNCEK